MAEVWLRPNVRALRFAMAPAAILALSGITLVVATPSTIARGFGGLLAAIGAAIVAALVWQLRQPRLAYDSGKLLVYLRMGPAMRVPIDAVECCFLGRAASGLRVEQAETAASSVVIRVAERFQEYANRNVHPALGSWQDGYITIRGTWCEPLNLERVGQLNIRLRQLQEESRTSGVVSA